MLSDYAKNHAVEPQAITRANAHEVVRLAGLETGSIWDVAFSPDGAIIATSSYDESIRLWDARTFKLVDTWRGHAGFAESLGFSPDGRLLASGHIGGILRLWSPATGKEIGVLTEDYPGTIAAIAFSPDGRLLAFAGGDISSSPVVDYSVWVWDMETNRSKFVFREHGDWVVSLAFSPDGRVLASGSLGGSIHLWDIETGKRLTTLRDGIIEVYCVAFSPDGEFLAASSWLGGIRLWDAKQGELIKHWVGHGEPQAPGTGPGIRIKGLAFNKDGELLATVGEDGVTKLWDVKAEKALLVLREEKRAWLNNVVFSPDGSLLVTGGSDGAKTQVWGISHLPQDILESRS